MTCGEFRESLLGEAGLRVRLSQFRHARRCASCRAVAQATRQIAGTLRQLPRHAPPPDLRERLLSVATEGKPVRAGTQRVWPGRRIRWVSVPLVLLALLVWVAGLLRKPKRVLAQTLADLRVTIYLVPRVKIRLSGDGLQVVLAGSRQVAILRERR